MDPQILLTRPFPHQVVRSGLDENVGLTLNVQLFTLALQSA